MAKKTPNKQPNDGSPRLNENDAAAENERQADTPELTRADVVESGELPKTEPPQTPVVDVKSNTPVWAVGDHAMGEATPAWEPPAGHIVSDEKTYHIRVGGVRYVHVSDAPDGRWVYRAD